MKIIPQKNNVLCEKIVNNKEKVNVNNFEYEKENMPIYKVIDIGHNTDHNFFNVNDNIIVNSTGTLTKVDDKEYYLFNVDNIVAKVD